MGVQDVKIEDFQNKVVALKEQVDKKEAQLQQTMGIGERIKVDLAKQREHAKAADAKNRLMTRQLFDLQADHDKLVSDNQLKVGTIE